MTMQRVGLLFVWFSAGCADKSPPGAAAKPQTPAPGPALRIGVLTDLSGVYAGPTGKGSVEAARMAVEDFGGKVNGTPIEVVFGDHLNKPDVGASLTRQWLDVDKVDAIVD